MIPIITCSGRTGHITPQRTREDGVMLYYLYMDDNGPYRFVPDLYIHIDNNREMARDDKDYACDLAIHNFAGKALSNGVTEHIEPLMGTLYTGISFRVGWERALGELHDQMDIFLHRRKKIYFKRFFKALFSARTYLIRHQCEGTLKIGGKRNSSLPFGGSWQSLYIGHRGKGFLKEAEKLAGGKIFIT